MKFIRYLSAAVVLGLLACASYGQEAKKDQPKHEGPTAGQQAKNIVSSPFHADHKKFKTGLRKTPRHKLAWAKRFVPSTNRRSGCRWCS